MNATASEMRNAIKSYYNAAKGSDITVTKTLYDANDTETTNLTLGVKSLYNITLRKLITGPSVSNIMAMKSGSASLVTINMPTDVQLSSTPLSGKFKIQCMDDRNYTSYSNSISVGADAGTVKYAIMWGCAKMNDKIEVWKSNDFAYSQNGFGYHIRYAGKNEDVGQAIIVSDVD